MTGATQPMRLIATEEAYGDPIWLDALNQLSQPGMEVEAIRHLIKNPLVGSRMSDFDARLREMDACGVDMHVLSLSAPGVQVFAPALASALASQLNDNLARRIAANPGRFAGLACVAPHDPDGAAREVARAVNDLGLNGVLINSHTGGEYLDEPRYDPLLAALAQAKAPLYLHPRVPPPGMAQPMLPYGLYGAAFGFAVEAGLHAARLIMSGAFDRYPDLTVILGHMGEGLPYFLWRLDNVYELFRGTPIGAAMGLVELRKKPSDYFRGHFYITTSGMFWEPTLKFALEVLGEDRIMFAIDVPYERSGAAVDFIRSARLDDTARAKITHRNAERVFKLVPSDAETSGRSPTAKEP